MAYVIRFDLGGREPVYAGFVDGAWGIALTPLGVARFNDRESAERTLLECYGAQAVYGSVVPARQVERSL